MKWRIVVAAVVAAGVAGNHLEHYVRADRLRREAADWNMPIVRAGSDALGHGTLSVDEQSGQPGNRDFLNFTTLQSWAYSKDSPTTCPEAVRAVDGHEIRMLGFMYPLQEANNLRVFCLLRTTQTCCYGPLPDFNQYVKVRMAEPVKFERLAPVVVQGRFMVDPNPEAGYIYRMEGRLARPAFANDQPPTAEEFARQSNLPLFDISMLESIQRIADRAERERQIARLAREYDGKPMVVTGYVVGAARSKAGSAAAAGAADPIQLGKYPELKVLGAPPSLIGTGKPGASGLAAPIAAATSQPGRDPFGAMPLFGSGVNPRAKGPAGLGAGAVSPSKGNSPIAPAALAAPPSLAAGSARLPDFYNSVVVRPRGPKDTPPSWWSEAVYSGTIHVATSQADRGADGLVSLRDATLAVGGSGLLTDKGPFLPWPMEALFLAASLAAVVLGLFVKKTKG